MARSWIAPAYDMFNNTPLCCLSLFNNMGCVSWLSWLMSIIGVFMYVVYMILMTMSVVQLICRKDWEIYWCQSQGMYFLLFYILLSFFSLYCLHVYLLVSFYYNLLDMFICIYTCVCMHISIQYIQAKSKSRWGDTSLRPGICTYMFSKFCLFSFLKLW